MRRTPLTLAALAALAAWAGAQAPPPGEAAGERMDLFLDWMQKHRAAQNYAARFSCQNHLPLGRNQTRTGRGLPSG